MPRHIQRISKRKPVEYARFPQRTYSTIQQGLMQVLVERKVGRNGLMVMIALCGAVYADGRLGRMSSDLMSEITGLTANQNARGMKELRDKKIITPVIRRTKEDYRHPDRSNFGHVAQYCFTKEVWARIETISNAISWWLIHISRVAI